ncbi:MAG: M14 family metallopeptidase [Bdellovibrionales bacterium]
MQFSVIYQLPERFVHCHMHQLVEILPGPSLIDIKGRDSSKTMFVSIILHGNEPTGLYAIQKFLKHFGGIPPVNLCLLVGNVFAAEHGVRMLHGQPDFNRIWNGDTSLEEQWASQVKKYVLEKNPFVVVDLHNNTGRNPHYACINQLDDSLYRLSGAFNNQVVYFETPKETLSIAFSEDVPAVTLECGLPHDLDGVDRAFNYLVQLAELGDLERLPQNKDFVLYEVQSKITVKNGFDIFVGDKTTDNAVSFLRDLDEFNFNFLSEGTVIGRALSEETPLKVVDAAGLDVHDLYLRYEFGKIIVNQDVVPSMISLDPRIISQDCLGYLMMEKEL